MKDCRVYTSDGQEIKLQNLNCEITAITDYPPPRLLDEMKIENISICFKPPERLTYEQYCNPVCFLMYSDDYKQAKPHHKGRINKKWAKRYGYVLTKAADVLTLRGGGNKKKGGKKNEHD